MIKVFSEIVNFAMKAIIFCLLFAYLEPVALGHDVYYKNLGEAFYYFATSITTIGYGDYSPQTIAGKLLFIGFVCGYGVYKMVGIVELFLEAKRFKANLKKIGRLFMPFQDHVVVFFNAHCFSKNNFLFLERFIEENKNSSKFSGKKIVLVNSNINYSEKLHVFLEGKNSFDDTVELINADIYEKDLLMKLDLLSAEHVYVFGDLESEMASDSKVYDTVCRIKEHGFTKDAITLELVDDNIRNRVKEKGVRAIIRPNRSYPELIVRATISPGSEQMLEELLSSRGDSIVTITLKKSEPFKWVDALTSLSLEGIGTLIGHVAADGTVDPNPKGTDVISDSKKVLMMVYDVEHQDYFELSDKVNSLIFK
jgi:voltage-gated potassium channel